MFQFENNFPASDAYSVEYDESSRTIDFISKKKTARRAPERVITFTISDGSVLKFQTACYENAIVDDSFVCDILEEEMNTPFSPSADEKENMFSQNSQMSIVTPVEDGNKKRQRFNSTPHGKAMEATINMSPDIVTKVVDEFFKADLNPFVEELSLVSPTMALGKKEAALPFVPILLSIEGNIGAGKSFLLKRLREEHPEWVFIDEPVDFWESLKNEKGESLLTNFYNDQRRWSYTFQNCALLSRFQNIETCVEQHRAEYLSKVEANTATAEDRCKIFITERCLDTDHEVFAKMLNADGQLDLMEFTLYERWFGLLQQTATQLSAIVHVDTAPNLCSDRITLRNRTGESGIPLEYLCSLDKFQSAWIDTTHVPVTRTTSDDSMAVTVFVDSLLEQFHSSSS